LPDNHQHIIAAQEQEPVQAPVTGTDMTDAMQNGYQHVGLTCRTAIDKERKRKEKKRLD